MEKEYVLSVANEIRCQIIGMARRNVIMSWGVDDVAAVVFKGMPSLLLKVNGRLHKGYVVVALDEGADYYRVYLQDEKKYRLIAEDVDFTQLADVIDTAIESGTNEAEYEEFAREQLRELFTN